MKTIVGHIRQQEYLKRLSESSDIPQTYLFTGLNGIGKKLVAKRLGQSVFCKAKTRPCGECERCKQFASGRLQDVVYLSPDEKGKIKVGDADEPNTVRWFVRRLSEKPISGTCFALVDGVDSITAAGQNILLKTVEEPGSGVYIVLLASSQSQVLSTIKSRSVKVEFQPLSTEQLSQALGESFESHTLEECALALSGGSPGIALALMEEGRVERVLSLAKMIKMALFEGHPFEYDSKDENFPTDFSILDILINGYHLNIRHLVHNEIQYNRYLDQLTIDDIDVIHRLIKQLLQIKRDMKFNINLKHALKAAVLDIERNGTHSDGIYLY